MRAIPTVDEFAGLGEIRFGMSPAQVKGLMGETLQWEAWMGGNLNDALYYSGIILFFDDHESAGPTSTSALEHIEVRTTFKARWREVELSSLTREVVTSKLGAHGMVKEWPNGNCVVSAPRLVARFAPGGELISLSIGKYHDA